MSARHVINAVDTVCADEAVSTQRDAARETLDAEYG